MGLLRILLAIGVVCAHTEAFFGTYFALGRVSVQAFYIISGFYMAMVLQEKYLEKKGGYKLFITNRFLRLYPPYWVVLGFVILVSALSGYFRGDFLKLSAYISYYSELDIGAWFYLVSTNLLLFGQDVAMFLGFDSSGGLEFTSNFRNSEPMVFHFLLIHQAWTVGVELTFYLIAPFLANKKNYVLIVIAFLSVAARVFFYNQGLDHDPWTYRFFPFELVFFIVGILSYRFYSMKLSAFSNPNYSKPLFVTILIFSIAYSFLPDMLATEIIYFLALAFSLPFIFHLTKSSKWDRAIGEYSYLVYLSHFIFIKFAGKIISMFGFLDGDALSEITVLLSFVFSYFIIKLVTNNIEKIRAKRVSQAN
jgi:peptidoglycan/LPS O-acetylase OafA/YrhL